MMRRDHCLQQLARHRRDDDIVVATYQAAFDWMQLAPHPLNYLSVGAMGQASSHALGLALGLPDRRVIVLDGDGSLLMNLGSLVTIAGAAPHNLFHFVCDNWCYEANGSHPLPAADRVDFAALARAAGIPHVASFDQVDVLAAGLPRLLAMQGPVFVALKVVAGDSSPQDYAFIHSEETRRRFKAALHAAS
jgi:sulfopyruvate decarboxylase subunit beta